MKLTGVKKIIKISKSYFKENQLLKSISQADRSLIIRLKKDKLTYLNVAKLISIVSTLKEIEQNKIAGTFIEAGCALGGTTILLTKLKDKERLFNVYDVFGMIPPPTIEDTADVHERYKIIKAGKSKGIGDNTYYGYEEHLYEKVVANIERYNIHLANENVNLIKGLLQDTMDIDSPVAFAHIDVDWYDPVKCCLQRIWPNLVVGGSIILDDYNDWGGCKKAVDEFFDTLDDKILMNDEYGSLKVTRIS